MHYVIWNQTQRKWVGPSGRKSAYVRSRYEAKRFPTREAAKADCCGDEEPVVAFDA